MTDVMRFLRSIYHCEDPHVLVISFGCCCQSRHYSGQHSHRVLCVFEPTTTEQSTSNWDANNNNENGVSHGWNQSRLNSRIWFQNPSRMSGCSQYLCESFIYMNQLFHGRFSPSSNPPCHHMSFHSTAGVANGRPTFHTNWCEARICLGWEWRLAHRYFPPGKEQAAVRKIRDLGKLDWVFLRSRNNSLSSSKLK